MRVFCAILANGLRQLAGRDLRTSRSVSPDFTIPHSEHPWYVRRAEPDTLRQQSVSVAITANGLRQLAGRDLRRPDPPPTALFHNRSIRGTSGEPQADTSPPQIVRTTPHPP